MKTALVPNPAWKHARYERMLVMSDGSKRPYPVPERGNKIVNGQLVVIPRHILKRKRA